MHARDNPYVSPSGTPARLSRCDYTLSACSYKKIAICTIVASDAQAYDPFHIVAASTAADTRFHLTHARPSPVRL